MYKFIKLRVLLYESFILVLQNAEPLSLSTEKNLLPYRHKKKLLVALWWVWLKIAVPASGADPYELLYGYGIRIHADPDQDPRKIIKNVLPKIQFLIINIIHKLI